MPTDEDMQTAFHHRFPGVIIICSLASCCWEVVQELPTPSSRKNNFINVFTLLKQSKRNGKLYVGVIYIYLYTSVIDIVLAGYRLFLKRLNLNKWCKIIYFLNVRN